MLGNLMSVVALLALLCYMYGALVTVQDPVKNECKMTYMFEYPQFVLSQLNTGTPYIDDYYYTVFKERRSRAKGERENHAHKDNQMNHPFSQPTGHAHLVLISLGNKNHNQRNNNHHHNNNNNHHQSNGRHNNNNMRERKNSESKDGKEQTPRTYTPLQFENSLGKLQCGSVTAPRKIIDMDVVGAETSSTSGPLAINTEITMQRKSRQLLIHIETLYRVVLKLEDFENPTAIATALVIKKIHVPANDQYPKYNLFAYSEGRHTEHARNMKFTGAPVIFVHGNAGSYKQVRSLASVARRKAMDLNWSQHLDYFTVDFNEEYLGLFGGFLNDQSDYLSHCIQTVLKLYQHLANPPMSVVVVTHSMGAKTIQASLMNPNSTTSVNTILMLSAPVDRPVVNVDVYFEAYYRNIDQYWLAHRRDVFEAHNTTNTCCRNGLYTKSGAAQRTAYKPNQRLNDVLLVTIGGGEQDLMVHSGLTSSKFSDVHTMSTRMPNVWLSTDHLCSVWCLQQVIVINRFLYNIITPSKSRRDTGQQFLTDKAAKLQIAQRHFLSNKIPAKSGDEIQLVHDPDNIGEWVEDSRRVFSLDFAGGFQQTRYQMVRMTAAPQTQYLHVEAINVDSDDWLFGCAAIENFKHSRFCTNGVSLAEFIEKIPSKDTFGRMVASLDLHKIKTKFPRFTHVLVRTPKTSNTFKLNVDIHGAERDVELRMPKWYVYSWFDVLAETVSGSSALRLRVSGMDESYQSIQLELEATRCTSDSHHSTAKVCVPWTQGFERFHHFAADGKPFYLYAPTSKPTGYNTTSDPVSVDLYLDPSCSYTIRARSSFGVTMSRIVLQFSQWLPAHLTAILLLALKHQLNISPKGEPFKCGTLYSGLLNSSSFFIITASRVFIKMILWTNVLPAPDAYEHSMLISVVIHGSALAILILFTSILWSAVRVSGDLANYLSKKFGSTKDKSSGPSTFWTIVVNCPVAIGIVVISMMLTSCGGVALILAIGIYFAVLVKLQMDSLQIEVPVEKPKEDSASKDETPAEGRTEDEQPLLSEEVAEDSDEEIAAKALTASKPDASDGESNDDIPSTSELDNELQLTEEEKQNDAELNRLIKETIESRKNNKALNTDEAQKRAEYDATPVGVNCVNFHVSMFANLVLLAVLNGPSVLAWLKNFEYSHALGMDPSFIPAVVVLITLSIIWQVKSPRDIAGYSTIGSLLYVLAVICVLYCQDSMYRLNAIIATACIFVGVHQLFTPNVSRPDSNGPPTDTKTLTPEQIEAAMAEIMKMETIEETANSAS